MPHNQVPLDSNSVSRVIDVILPSEIGFGEQATPIPVIAIVNGADQRRWCRATQEWLVAEQAPADGCPTDDLRDDGSCQRSAKCGRCLLLLPFDHPDWEPAFQEEYAEPVGAFMLRDEPVVAPLGRQPLPLEVLER